MTKTPQKGDMAKRLPRPENPVRTRCEVSDEELKTIEDAAHSCRLSVASWIRVALIAAAKDLTPEKIEAWNAIAEELRANSPPDRKKPGRPKKGQ